MRVRAIMIRILIQLKHDKRTMALMIFAPMLIMTFMTLIFGGSDYHPKIGIVNAPQSFVTILENEDAKVTFYSEGEAEESIRDSQLDAVINFKNGAPYVLLEGSDPSKSKAVLMLVQKLTQQSLPLMKPDITYVYGYANMSSIDNFGPILIGFFVFFIVFLIAGVSFLGERTTGTLERLLATPLRRWEIVVGYVLGFGVFTIVQSALISLYSVYVLHLFMVGSFALVLLITVLTAMVSLTIGIFISAFTNNELQMIQFIPIVIVPQVFFSGLLDVSTMAPWLQALGRFMPLTYIADALRNIMIRGKGWYDIQNDVFVLAGICLFFIVANVLVLKRYRSI
ncbi:Inner membrane transport permease YbhR [Paenibacillus konkukensis]|uniref:Inner membrane transport permease YbhR n=1 Tax=Paenibacillus konkukensis TaxID=2020716 RepID=A0ABY4REE8_9BACL|nr:ABC transporter permease [Paenibacillus konkukensis]UQZ81054.1 Inner membrane transport permease YbhR [Paenibacillus konkukensis]